MLDHVVNVNVLSTSILNENISYAIYLYGYTNAIYSYLEKVLHVHEH